MAPISLAMTPAPYAAASAITTGEFSYETYGLAVGEAAARGIPAIVSDGCAAAERVRHGVTGWHARTNDVDDLAAHLQLAKDDTLIRNAGQAAYDAFWRQPPTRAAHVDGLLAVYEAVL